MQCKCGGTLSVIRIEEYPENIIDKINYIRLCDVECLVCGQIYYSQPYDFGKRINKIKKIKNR